MKKGNTTVINSLIGGFNRAHQLVDAEFIDRCLYAICMYVLYLHAPSTVMLSLHDGWMISNNVYCSVHIIRLLHAHPW